MKNISESSDGNEQASRPTSTRNRNPARSRSEDATAGSQAAENKTGVRRRTPPSTPTANTPAPSAQHSRANTVASPQTQRPNGTPLPTQTRRVGNTATPVQRNGTAGATPHAQRPASTGHPTPGTGHRPSSPGSYAQRTGGPATPAPKPSTGSLQQRPASPTHSSKTVSRPGSSTGGTPRPTSPARPATPAPRPQERRVTAVKEKPTGPISIPPQIIVKDLAELLQATPNEVIRSLIKHCVFASINQVVEYEKAAIIAKELGFEPSLSTVTAPAVTRGTHGLSANEAMMASRNEENMVVIPPVVTIMGHVDNGKKITFLDTPGHEAFTAMRARGAQVTHIAIIVVAADDGVMPQTREAIDHAQAAKVLVQQGTLKMGDNIVVGALAGKVRAMFNDRGKRIQKAPPSLPVSILGLPEVPQAGDHLEVTPDERTAKQRAKKVVEQRRNDGAPLGQVSLDSLYTQMQEGTVKELNVVLKCDVQGSAEAIKNALTKLGEENIKVRLIHEGIGNISETDVHLAAASKAIVIGFNVKADGAAQREAQKEGVDIRYYNVIYKLTDDIQAALVGMLEPTFREVIEGHAEVVQIFKAGKTTVIAGCRVSDGKITRSSQARILRKDVKVYEGKIGSLRRGKDDVREVTSGYECGIVLDEFTDFEIGDIIEAFTQERVKARA